MTYINSCHTVDGRNPAPVDMVVYAMIYKVLYMSGGDRRISEPSTVGLTIFLSSAKAHHVSSPWRSSPWDDENGEKTGGLSK